MVPLYVKLVQLYIIELVLIFLNFMFKLVKYNGVSIYFLKTCKQTVAVCLQFAFEFDFMTSFSKFINSQRGSHNFLLLLAHKRLWTQSRQKLLRVIFSKLNDFCVRNFAIIYIFKSIAFSCREKAHFGCFQAKIRERADFEKCPWNTYDGLQNSFDHPVASGQKQ